MYYHIETAIKRLETFPSDNSRMFHSMLKLGTVMQKG